jgi:hypothetical protein
LQLKEINGSAISKKKSINRGNRSYPNGILEGPLNVAINYHTDPHLNTIVFIFIYVNVTNKFFFKIYYFNIFSNKKKYFKK